MLYYLLWIQPCILKTTGRIFLGQWKMLVLINAVVARENQWFWGVVIDEHQKILILGTTTTQVTMWIKHAYKAKAAWDGSMICCAEVLLWNCSRSERWDKNVLTKWKNNTIGTLHTLKQIAWVLQILLSLSSSWESWWCWFGVKSRCPSYSPPFSSPAFGVLYCLPCSSFSQPTKNHPVILEALRHAHGPAKHLLYKT